LERSGNPAESGASLQAPHQNDGGQANLKEIPKFVILNFGYAQRRRLRRVL
jgi:hypothetical protein